MRSPVLASALVTLVGCGPRAEVEVAAARDLGPSAETPQVKGRDGGYSGLAFGRSVWLFGDTVLHAADSRGSSWRHDSWSWTADLDAHDGLADFVEPIDEWGGAAEFFPYTPDEWAFNEAHAPHDPECEDPCGARVMLWPAALVDDPERERTLVFHQKFGGEPGAWNFWPIGASVAIWTEFEAGPIRPMIDESAAEPTLLWTDPEPLFGAAAVIDRGWLYAFACEGEWDKHCQLARVDPERVLERDQWRYWDGRDYGHSLADAEPVFDGHTILSVHFNAHLDRWLAIYSEPLGTAVMLRTAEALEGPWSREVVAFEAEASHDGAAPYSALGHPELAREGGRIEYVSYFRSPGDWDGEIRLVELVLERP
ncbi:DUF4185 domain-containing protein [Nannocystaceae bacterium ST9]